MWGMWGGGPGHGDGHSPACVSILHHGSGRCNQVFALIWGQVFPLVLAVGRPVLACQMKLHPWEHMWATISIVASERTSSLACRQGTAERRFGQREIDT